MGLRGILVFKTTIINNHKHNEKIHANYIVYQLSDTRTITIYLMKYCGMKQNKNDKYIFSFYCLFCFWYS